MRIMSNSRHANTNRIYAMVRLKPAEKRRFEELAGAEHRTLAGWFRALAYEADKRQRAAEGV